MRCLTYEEVVALYHEAMSDIWHERFYGIRDEALLRSALARPQQAAAYEETDLATQAAHLFHGLLKNHPFIQGNKRTAFYCLVIFLQDNGRDLDGTNEEAVELAYRTEDGGLEVRTIADWVGRHMPPATLNSVPRQAGPRR